MSSPPEPLSPGARVGILGGGQLGRMLAMAAARMGLVAHVYDPDPRAPAHALAGATTVADWDDAEALGRFASAVDVITYEFENIPLAMVERLSAQVPVRPSARALEASQDRLAEKRFLAGIGLATAPFAEIAPGSEAAAIAATGLPSILKTRRMGYDGKGQARIDDLAALGAALSGMGQTSCILEGVVNFSAEISVIAARGLSGEVACFDPGLNEHRGGILHRTQVPAPLPRSVQTDAVLLAGRILGALDYVGVMGVELFVTQSGLVVNEIAPRVHNSGHWTEAGCAVDQFEQHLRAICGWPLGDGARHADVEMTNLLGGDVETWAALAADPTARLHLYGKGEARPGRKMGHVNRVRPRAG
ncbi:MAG: 5-(carboxyamino)imidazole ribonucleotide synthase [Rhodobacteraceae bacterium]|nr:5-(carboxyamino)imidazole ribonucleotide synthase [Paracoccaceae bacterium]